MNILYIRELCKRNRTGEIIKLMNDNIYLWSKDDYDDLIDKIIPNNVVILKYILEKRYRLSSIYDSDTLIKTCEISIKYNVINHVNMKMNYILNNTCFFDSTSYNSIKYILSDIFLKCVVNVYTIEEDDTHSIFGNLFDSNMTNSIKFIMSDENIFRIYPSRTIGEITTEIHYDSIYEDLGLSDYSYKWNICYLYENECQYMYANSGYDPTHMCTYCGCGCKCDNYCTDPFCASGYHDSDDECIMDY